MLLFGCKKYEAEYARLSELGTDTTLYTVGAAQGELKVNVLSNENYEVIVPDSLDWLSSANKSLRGDTSFNVHYEQNTGFPRKGIVVLYAQSSDRYDTVTIRQRGDLTPELNFPVLNTSVLGDGGKVTSKLESNIPMDQLTVEVVYPGGDEDNPTQWVDSDYNYDQSKQEFSFSVKPNPAKDSLRSAQIRLSYTDGWGEQVVSTLYLLQANAQNLFGTKASFPDIRLWAGEKISSDLFIEGYVISDKGNKNVAEETQTTPTKVDYTANEKAVYIESVDGKYGFRLNTATVADNIFKRYSKVQILLKGTTVSEQTDPDAYTIDGVTSSMVMSQTQGTAADIVRKEKYISELTDDDINTFVTLKDCELPIRKGSLTPMNEGYTILYNASRVNKYPLLVRDIQGSSIFLMTNMDVPDRRDGSMLPQGSGELSGVIVHETFTRFEYQDAANPDDYGNIGRYEIRWLDKKDIALAKDVNSGFSSLLVEYQYPNITSGVAYPTNGSNGRLYASNNEDVYATTSYYYLGPCGADHKGNTNQWGTGVLINGSKQNTVASTNSDGKGATGGDGIAASRTWWDYNKNRGEAWILELSTSGISTDELSLQFTALNFSSVNGPRYWAVEWSEQPDMDGSWKPIAKYTVPDVANWSNTLLTQLPAYKNINVKLPLEMLGKAQVYIRLIVDKNLCSDGYTYASEPIAGNVNSSIGYLAIRYNK